MPGFNLFNTPRDFLSNFLSPASRPDSKPITRQQTTGDMLKQTCLGLKLEILFCFPDQLLSKLKHA